MKKLLFALLFATSFCWAQQTITIYTPYSASHGGNAAFMRVLEQANLDQKTYQFRFELKPGAQGLIALRTVSEQPHNRLAIINAAFVELVETKQTQENDWKPIHAIGEACWAVTVLGGDEKQGISSIRNLKELVVGTVGVGNVSHLTALAIGDRLGIPVRLILFKSNNDALVNLVGNNGVNFVIERYSLVSQFREKNPNIRAVAMSCPTRYDAMHVATLREQELNLPGIINIVMANRDMDQQIQKEIAQILDNATKKVGLHDIQMLSDMRSPIFDGVSTQEFYQSRISALKNLRKVYRKQIESDRN
jgi:hypothetical protein